MPYKLYSLTLEGDADLYGQSSYLDGVNKTTREEKVSFGIRGRFENVAFDVSAGFDDTLAEQIVPFEMDHSRDFDPVYLAGSYANIPDVDDNIYKEKTLEVAAQKTLDAMHESFERKAVTLADYPDGSSVSEHLPVKEMTDYTAFFPVWFLSFRKGNRIAYAAVNGQTGKVYSDIPVSLPAFWAGCLALVLPPPLNRPPRCWRAVASPRPMKYINNALLALILSVLINYLALCLQSERPCIPKPSLLIAGRSCKFSASAPLDADR